MQCLCASDELTLERFQLRIVLRHRYKYLIIETNRQQHILLTRVEILLNTSFQLRANGTINFISKGYTGRKSDQFIVRHCGYKDNLKEGDGVLADKGFDVGEEIGLMGATLTTPAFKLAAQLTHKETEVSRRVSNVRIHLEREIGSLRMRFGIMCGLVVMFNLNNFAENVCLHDKIVTVCCTISN